MTTEQLQQALDAANWTVHLENQARRQETEHLQQQFDAANWDIDVMHRNWESEANA